MLTKQPKVVYSPTLLLRTVQQSIQTVADTLALPKEKRLRLQSLHSTQYSRVAALYANQGKEQKLLTTVATIS